MSKKDILGVQFDNYDIAVFTELSLQLINERRSAYVVTPNTEMVLEAQKN